MIRWKYQQWEKCADDVQEMELALHEYCRVRRWRTKDSQGEAAKKVGVSRSRLNKMELGEIPCAELLAHWGYDREKLIDLDHGDEGEDGSGSLTPNLLEI
jgi:DNA-binding XRE family transcriptional regulator